jgi:hypothetical protein
MNANTSLCLTDVKSASQIIEIDYKNRFTFIKNFHKLCELYNAEPIYVKNNLLKQLGTSEYVSGQEFTNESNIYEELKIKSNDVLVVRGKFIKTYIIYIIKKIIFKNSDEEFLIPTKKN